MKLTMLSYSRLRTFEECQLKYHAIYELKLEDEAHPLGTMGTAVHQAMEISTRARMLRRHEALWDPLRLIERVCSKHRVEKDLRPLAAELVQNALRWGYFNKVSNAGGCEEYFIVELADGTKVRGYIDRLDFGEQTDILDLKTQKRLFSQEELNDNWQARIYNVAVRKAHPGKVSDRLTVSFWMLRHEVQRVSLTSLDAERDERRLIEKADEIRECTDPRPNPTPLCQWCPYCDECPGPKMNLKQRLKEKMARCRQ